MKTCKLCGKHASALVRCHIYPKAMTRFLANPAGRLAYMSTRNGPRAGHGHGGMYDDNIVCVSCERAFFEADDYAIKFWKLLLRGVTPYAVRYRTLILRTYKASPDLLHRFCMQTLMRSFLSSRWEHDQVDLTVNLEWLTHALLSGASTLVDGPEVALSAIKDTRAANVMTPYVVKSSSHLLYQLWFPHLVASVACQSNLPEWMGPTILRPGNEVTVWHRRRIDDKEDAIFRGFFEPNALRVSKIMGDESR